MNPFIAPPNILGAIAYNAQTDDYLRQGVHLRIFAGTGPSFPVTPFIVYKVQGRRSPPNEGANVQLCPHPGLRDQSGSIRTAGNAPVRLTFKPVDGDLTSISLLDSSGARTIATRTRGPWTFSLPDWRWISARGSATRLMADAVNAPDDVLLHGEFGERVSRALVLPTDPGGPYAWYVGAEKQADKESRVGAGWPRVWGPREQHVFRRWTIGNNQALDPRPAPVLNPALTPGKEAAEETARVYKVLTHDGPRVGDMVQTMLTTQEPPWLQLDSVDSGGSASAQYNPLQMLQLAMCDYGVARYFGYGVTWPDAELRLLDDELLAIYTIVAFDPKKIAEADEGMVRYTIQRLRQIQTSNAVEKNILRAIAEDGLSNDPEAELQKIKNAAAGLGLIVAPFVSYASPVDPYDTPVLQRPQVVRRQWAAPEGNQPSDKWSAVFAFCNVPMCTLALLERCTGNAFLPRSGAARDDDPDAHYHWLQPSVFGREVEAASRRKEMNLPAGAQQTAAVLTDQAIPAAQSTGYRASASDVFGRFGPRIEFEADPPKRPAPNAPRLNYLFDKASPAPTSDAAESPGTLKISAKFDYSTNADPAPHSIAVPGIEHLPRGALRIEAIELVLSGTVQAFGQTGHVALAATPAVMLSRASASATIAIPALPPMAQAKLVLSATYVDSAGVRSETATAEMTVTDPRAPRPLKTGVGLLWTTRPSPAPQVTLDLSWDAPAGSEHLVYLGDERTLLTLPEGVGRCERGALLCKQAKTHNKTKYQRITPTPLKASGANKVSYTLSLPRTLESVQVVRIVPLGPDGAEPPFNDCTTVPVAVPSSRRPPPPLLAGEVDASTGKARLKVRVDGLNLDELRREEPGLFDPAKPGKELPRFRIRCSNGKVAHPMYAQVQEPASAPGSSDGSMPLELKSEVVGAETVYWFEASFESTALLPYVRSVYWAEVRLPPERCVPPDTTQVASGVSSVHPESGQPSVRLWGELSAPLVLMHAPAVSQMAASDVAVQVVDANPPRTKVSLTLSAPPPRASKVIGPYRLAAWYRWGDGPLAPAMDSAGTPLDTAWPEAWTVPELFVEPAPAAGSALNMHVALVDPIGRIGPITVIHP